MPPVEMSHECTMPCRAGFNPLHCEQHDERLADHEGRIRPLEITVAMIPEQLRSFRWQIILAVLLAGGAGSSLLPSLLSLLGGHGP